MSWTCVSSSRMAESGLRHGDWSLTSWDLWRSRGTGQGGLRNTWVILLKAPLPDSSVRSMAHTTLSWNSQCCVLLDVYCQSQCAFTPEARQGVGKCSGTNAVLGRDPSSSPSPQKPELGSELYVPGPKLEPSRSLKEGPRAVILASVRNPGAPVRPLPRSKATATNVPFHCTSQQLLGVWNSQIICSSNICLEEQPQGITPCFKSSLSIQPRLVNVEWCEDYIHILVFFRLWFKTYLEHLQACALEEKI